MRCTLATFSSTDSSRVLQSLISSFWLVSSQQPPANQEKQDVKETKESKEPVKEPVKESVKESVKEPLSEDELAKKTTALIDEYANIHDLKVKITVKFEVK